MFDFYSTYAWISLKSNIHSFKILCSTILSIFYLSISLLLIMAALKVCENFLCVFLVFVKSWVTAFFLRAWGLKRKLTSCFRKWSIWYQSLWKRRNSSNSLNVPVPYQNQKRNWIRYVSDCSVSSLESGIYNPN